MQYKIMNEEPFQILTSSISIGPSPTGYQLEVSADGKNFSPLFTVGANVTRQVTNLSSGSYYRLKGNEGQVVINWNRSCVTEGGADLSDYYTKEETDAIIQSAITSGVSLDAYWTSAQTESAITEAVSGKADAKIVIDFDHTSQAERASVYADLYALYSGGSGATINRNYDFFKTVNTWQGLKIDYYGFSGDTLVFGKVVSPENMQDQVVYEQVMTIDSEGNVEVVTNIVGGGEISDPTILKSVQEFSSAATDGDVQSKISVTPGGLPSGVTFVTGNTYGPNQDQYGGTLTIPIGFAAGTTDQNPIYLMGYTDGMFDSAHTLSVFENEWLTGGVVLYLDNENMFISMGPDSDSAGEAYEGNMVFDYQYTAPSDTVMVVNLYADVTPSTPGVSDPTFDVPQEATVYDGLYVKSGNTWMNIIPDMTQYTPTSGFSTINGSAITGGGNIVIVGGASGDTDTEILKKYTGSYSELEEGDLITFYWPTVCERLGMTYNGREAEPQYSDRSGYTIQFPNIYSGSYAEFTEESPATLGTIYLSKENPTGGYPTIYEILFYHDSSDNFCVKIKERDAATEYVFNLSAGTLNQYVFEDYTEFYMGFYRRSPFNQIQGTFLIGFQSPYDMSGKGSISVGVSNVAIEMKVGVVGRETLIKLGDIERIDRNTAQIQNAIHSLSSRTGNFITSGQADTQITNKLADYTPTSGFSTINGSAITEGGNIVIQGGGGGGDVTALSGAVQDLSATTESAITAVENHLYDVEEVTASALTELHNSVLVLSARPTPDMTQYTPTSGFATVNGSAITNGGNIVIQGGSGGGGISQADLASSGYLYFNHDGMGNTETNLDDAYDFLKGNDGDGYSVDPPQLVDYDAYDSGSAGTPPFPKHIVSIYRSDYDDLVNNGLPDGETFYIVLPDPE